MKAELLQSIIDAAKDAIFVIDVEGKVSYLNGAAEEMFGYPQGELMGENLHGMLVPESYRAAHAEGFRRFRETGKGAAIGETLELTALRRDGSEFPVELSLSAVRMGDGWHSVGIVRDISARKAVETGLRESAEHYTTLFESISEPIMLIDPETYVILRANESLKEQLKMGEGEIVGKFCYAVTHRREAPCEPPDDTCPLGELMETGKSVTVDHIHYDGEGGQFWTEVSVYPVLGEGGEISQVIHITRDISERKRIEEALTRSSTDVSGRTRGTAW